MVGISTALELQSRGHSVVVVDCRPPGRETSYGNAGIIQAEAAEPPPLPRNLLTLAGMALGFNNDFTWSAGALLSSAPALLEYYRHSKPSRHRAIGEIYSQLTSQSTNDHTVWVDAAGAGDLISRDGFCCVFRKAQALELAAQNMQRLCTSYDLKGHLLTGAEYAQEEPAITAQVAGAVHWQDSWTCTDPGSLTQRYAALFTSRGGEIRSGDARTLMQAGTAWSVTTEGGEFEAAAVIIALGPWAPALLKPLGYKIPMILKRGYHAHFNAPVKLRRPLYDVTNGILAAPMDKGLRLSTGVALVHHDAPPSPRQLIRGSNGVAKLMDVGERIDEPLWYGTRPVMPDMLPMVGAAPNHPGMWFNFGHGHQGFTLGPTTARILGNAIEGDDIDKDIQDCLRPGRLFG